ncbi:MAG: hypothetical protein ACRETC_04715 [Gammaproteobacteria bacterium]
MPKLNLNVTLVNGSLNVDQDGNANQMGHGQSGDIVWKLTGNAASGSFNAMDAANPGFTWKQQPTSGIFGQPGLENSGKHIKMSDNNTDPGGVNSSGTWIYQLWATIGGTQYSTIATLPNPTATTTNPWIKND